jgi:hypothetical protein
MGNAQRAHRRTDLSGRPAAIKKRYIMHAKNTRPAPTRTCPAGLQGLAVVALSDGTYNYGLYRVKQVETRTMLLNHGAISFPVGTHLAIEDFKYEEPNHTSFNQRATVVENSHDGIRLVW